jgi:rhodanese-related sulfurtransferase
MKVIINFVMFAFILIITGCSGEAAIKQMSVNDIPERMVQSIDTDDGAFYIDVREQSEYDEAFIDGFVNYPLSTLENTYKEFPVDKEIIIICRSGNRSMQAANFLREKGFEDITNVQGAMLEWRGEVKTNK